MSGDALIRHLDTVPFDTRKADFQTCALFHRVYASRLFGRLRRRNDRLGGKVEWYAHDVGILDVEQAIFVQLVSLAAEAATDHLVTQQLSSEGTHAKYVLDRVGVPPLRKHRNRDNTADLFAQPSLFADGI